MNTNENLHGGHRARMTDKFIASPNTMPDHEILEMLLYYAIPRTDTNPIAHRLLRLFGSLNGVFSAKPSELVAVEGVGEKTASFISLIGQVALRAFDRSEDPFSNIKKFSFNNNKSDLIAYFKGLKEERFIILMLDEKYNLISYATFNDEHRNSVTAEIPEITLAFALHRPKFAIISHNHPSGIVSPSKEDDLATAKLNAICSISGVTLIDHIICTNNDAYSYHYADKLAHIKAQCDINKLLNNL